MKKSIQIALATLTLCGGQPNPRFAQSAPGDGPPIASLQTRAEQGDAQAQFRLGMLYVEGQGVRQDYEKAADWLRKAARQGAAAAQLELGVMYENGEGMPSDLKEAYAWYLLASQQGRAPARKYLQDIAGSMSRTDQQAGRARAEELARTIQDPRGRPEPVRPHRAAFDSAAPGLNHGSPPANGVGFMPREGAPPPGPFAGKAPSPTTPAPAAAHAAGSLRFTRQAIRDPAANNVEAMVFLLPEGWRFEGRVHWLHQWSVLTFLQTRLTDPAHGITVEFLPQQNFVHFPPPAGLDAPLNGNYQGKQFLPPITDPDEFVRRFWMPEMLPHLRGARLVRSEPIPAATREYQRQLAGGSAQASTHRLRYEYEQGGRRWEEDVSFALLFFPSQVTTWQVRCGVSVRAPRGELDRQAGVISAVIASRTTTPEWEGIYQVVLRLFYQGQQQIIADTAAFGQALAQYREEVQARQKQVTEERQASQDRNSTLWREALANVETFRDDVNHKLVEMPAGWKGYWVNEKGEYLLSDQTGFNPNTGSTHTWQQMESRSR